MEYYDVIIVGAGPAGLFAAIQCAKNGLRVIVLEKNSSAGKKLLIAGAGRCNVTHEGDISDFLKHYGDNGSFLKKALYAFSNTDLCGYLEHNGVRVTSDENGKVFPFSNKSRDILELLLRQLEQYSGKILFNDPVKSLKQDGALFCVNTSAREYRSKSVVIATGGSSYPGTGSTGDGYILARELGHVIVEPVPALAPVYIKDYPFSELAGISFRNSVIQLYRNGKKNRQTCGDLLLTHKNLSGPAILDFSRYIQQGDRLRICFVEQKADDFRDRFLNDLQVFGTKTVKNVLSAYGLPERFVVALCKMAGNVGNTRASQLGKSDRKELIRLLTEYECIVTELADFNVAMVTRGGVFLPEVVSATMESKLVKGLYFAGEVLDIDGDTGGYNIQAAFSTGFLAAKSICT